jgi:hypothetical protein
MNPWRTHRTSRYIRWYSTPTTTACKSGLDAPVF